MKKPSTTKPKLSLASTTIRDLQPDRLDLVTGGLATCGTWTRTCTTSVDLTGG
jgi:hypothetical protein